MLSESLTLGVRLKLFPHILFFEVCPQAGSQFGVIVDMVSCDLITFSPLDG